MNKTNVSIYGSYGFIGSYYYNLFNGIRIPRNQIEPESNHILYFISTTDNYNVFTDTTKDIETNLIFLMKVLDACKNKYNNDFIFNFISSWFVYGKTNDLPAREDSICNPTGFYSITKRTAEQLLISYCETFNIRYRILRLGNVYGIGDTKVSKKKNAIQFLINQIKNNEDINLYDNGENIRDFSHVKDICNGINLVTNNGNLNEIYNVASGNGTKIIDIIKYSMQFTKSKSNIKYIETPDFHKIVQIKDMYLDISKIKALGYKNNIEIYDGIKEIILNN